MIFIELSQRKLKILSAIVENYIDNGEPVSSKNLCNILNLGVSSATLRNEMAELTELGFLEQPHTSAGRIPSDIGYRLYVDELMKKKSVPKGTKQFINESLKTGFGTPEDLINSASSLLADITKCAVISTTVSSEESKIVSVNIVKAGKYTAFMVLTTSSGVVKSKLFRVGFILEDKYMELFHMLLNKTFVGLTVSLVTPQLIKKVLSSLNELLPIVADVMLTFFELCSEVSKNTTHIEGQTNLLFISDFDSKSALSLINYLKSSDSILNLFLKAQDNKNALIGREMNREELTKSSVITKAYSVNGRDFGSIGIVGPMRMDYGLVISCMDYLTSEVEELLSNFLEF